MPLETSANIGLDYVMPAQAQKHVTVNESFRRLDALVQASVESRTLSVQPEDPQDGAVYILAADPAGSAWSSMSAGNLAYFRDGAWTQISPKTGWRCWIRDDNAFFVFDGTGWADISTALTELQNLALLGVNTVADAANPFSARLNSALWTARAEADGGNGDLRYVMNKEGDSDVLSVLFQSNWSGRAEFGLVGDNDFLIKVSGDGISWRESLRLDRASGAASTPNGLVTQTLNSGPLAGFRNAVINGGFDIWARGPSQSGTGYGSADRYSFISDDPAFSVSRETLAPGEIDAPLHSFARLSKPGDGTFGYFFQRIESVRTLAGRPVTLSFWARTADAAQINDIGLYQGFGTGGSAKVFNTVATPVVPTAVWQRHVFSMILPDVEGKTIGTGDYLEVFFNVFPVGAEPGTIDIAGIQLEPGTAATPFESRPVALEQTVCARYFQTKTLQSENGSRHVPLSTMRAAPSVTTSHGSVASLTPDGLELSHTSTVATTITASAEL